MPGVAPHRLFADRRALLAAGVHRHLQAGIAGSAERGAASVVLADGYEDDEVDEATGAILYTGFGGRNADTGRQEADQQMRGWNKALARSCAEGLPIRVSRKTRRGYEYLGLYRGTEYYQEPGRSGYLVWRYRLEPFEADTARDAPRQIPLAGRQEPERRPVTIQRIARSTPVAQAVKALHRHRCQVCGIGLVTPAGPYSEAAHIQPLGKPHDGPDVAENILCLCPNHHALLDLGALIIEDDLRVVSTLTGQTIGALHVQRNHRVDGRYLAHHRRRFASTGGGSAQVNGSIAENRRMGDVEGHEA